MDNNPTEQISFQPQQKYKNLIIILITIGLFLILMSGLTGYYFAKKQLTIKPNSQQEIKPTKTISLIPTQTLIIDETKNWKTYSDPLGFKVKMPIEWEIYSANTSTEKDDPVWNYLNTLSPNQLGKVNIHNKNGDQYINLDIYTNSKNQTTDSWSKSFFRSLDINPQINIASLEGTLIISGLPAKEFSNFNYGGDTIVIGIVYEDKIFEFSYDKPAGHPNLDSVVKLYKLILSTFSFSDLESINISQDQINKGWYWGSADQKLPGTPIDWIFKEAGRSSCWHKPNIKCF